jgi:hypothetical protein
VNWEEQNARVPGVLLGIYDRLVDEAGGERVGFGLACGWLREAIVQLRDGRKFGELRVTVNDSPDYEHEPTVEEMTTQVLDVVELGACEILTPDDGLELWCCANAVYELKTAIAEHERRAAA